MRGGNTVSQTEAFNTGTDRIARTLDQWRRQLLDTSKMSKLINCKFSRGSGGASAGGALLLEYPSAEVLWEAMAINEKAAAFAWASKLLPHVSPTTLALSSEPAAEAIDGELPSSSAVRANLSHDELNLCLSSDQLKSDELLTGLFDKRLDTTLKRMNLAAHTSLSEQGITSLFLAFGFVRWFESIDSEIEIVSPLLLLPVTLSKEYGQSTWMLRPLDEEIAVNHSLAELFRADFRISLPEVEDESLRGGRETLANYLTTVRSVIAAQTKWTVDARVALGSFGFQKISMWKDLRSNESHVIDHPLCRSIAGDRDAMFHGESSNGGVDVALQAGLADRAESDVNPALHNLILDCDGSQLAAVTAVKNGSHLILDGPPGTGKSQTIANMIAEALATGKSVLFVSEKSAALEVVKRRLDAKNLGDFCLECHSHKSNKRRVIEELGRCLSHDTERYPAQDEKLSELNRCRETLNQYVHALHAKRSELGLSAYQMHARLAPLCSAPVSRVDIAEPHRVDQSTLRAIEETVARLVRAEAIIAQHGEHPWKGCRPELITLSFVDDAQHHFQRAADALERRRIAASPLVELGLLPDPFSETQLQEARQRGKAATAFPLLPEIWIQRGLRNPAEAAIRLDELAGEFRIAMSAAEIFNRKTLGSVPLELFQNIDRVAKSLIPVLPAMPPTLHEMQRHLHDVQAQISAALPTIAPLIESATALVTLLKLSETAAHTAAAIRSVTEAGKVLVAAGKIPDAWFDDTQRPRLKNALLDAHQASEFANLARKPLVDRLQPMAFHASSRAMAEELLQHSSFFGRFDGRWRRAKLAFSGLYREAPTKSRIMIDDAYLLRKYHAADDASVAAAQIAGGATVGWDGSTPFDWQLQLAHLAQFDAISPDILSAPGFVSIATKLDSVAVAHIRTSVSDVERNQSAFATAFASLPAIVSYPATIGAERAEDVDLRSFYEAMVGLQNKLSTAEGTFRTSFDFVAASADVRVDQLLQDLDVLSTLRNLHREAAATGEKINESVAPIEAGDLGEYARQAKLGRWLLRFVDHFSGKPPESLVRLLFDGRARATLASALKAIDDADTAELATSINFVADAFPMDRPISSGIVLKQIAESQKISWLRDRARDAKASLEWRDYQNTFQELERCGLTVLRDEVLAGTIAPREALAAFRSRFYKRWLDAAYESEPLLREFDPGVHDHVAERFRELDRFWIHNGYTRIRPALLDQWPKPTRLGGTPPNTSEIGVLLRETNKKRRHLPLRKLFAQMPTLLRRLKPCIMMSPLSVSTYFESSNVRFDLVIFDEASQVRPHDAICAIYRGKQLVVAGDQKQLPPTNFFERLTSDGSEDENEEEISTNDYESILDTCASLGLPRQRLKWHYRSRRESLISFSNRNFYDGELITFPSVFDVDGSSGVTFHYIADAQRGKPGSVTNAVEATRIAEAVIKHATLQPDKSLGVITMNVGQQMLVMDEISRLSRNDSKIGSFFSADNPEPFFVKNLENVQGDERDFIFMGIGFAKNELGKLNHSFGPLNRSGGERRLNVAVTRARESLCVFSSIKAQDIDRSRTTAVGAALLQAYLDFAERGPIALIGANSETGGAENDSEFEAEVEKALRAHGLDVRRQVGCCGYRIDLAIVDPNRKGRYVLGVEADGATYHSSASARDRDRLRQELLESLGWRIARIWSTDWIRNPQRQVERVLKAYSEALAAADVTDQPQPRVSVEAIEATAVANGLAEPAGSAVVREYKHIAEVPSHAIGQSLHKGLRDFGSMTIDDLLQHAARDFGFSRLGVKIRDRLHASLLELQRIGSVTIEGDRVVLIESASTR